MGWAAVGRLNGESGYYGGVSRVFDVGYGREEMVYQLVAFSEGGSKI